MEYIHAHMVKGKFKAFPAHADKGDKSQDHENILPELALEKACLWMSSHKPYDTHSERDASDKMNESIIAKEADVAAEIRETGRVPHPAERLAPERHEDKDGKENAESDLKAIVAMIDNSFLFRVHAKEYTKHSDDCAIVMPNSYCLATNLTQSSRP